jgi:tRNA 5-methylaminomethyl-2-thiouridine biosynthesis bifunctional protein
VRVTVIGAGIAGASAAYACALRGMDVTVVERHDRAAAEASGNPAGILYPFMASQWDAATLFYLQGFSHTLHTLRSAQHIGARFALCGMAHYPKNETDDERVRLQQIPERLVLETEIAMTTDYGMWMPHSGWVDVPSLTRALFSHANIRLLTHHDAISVTHANGTWVTKTENTTLASDVLILANAHEAARLFSTHTLPMRRIRGQITYLPERYVTPISYVLCYGGYLTPAIDGVHYLGATFDHGREDLTVDTAGHVENLLTLHQRFPALLKEMPQAETLQGRAAFRTVSGDRMPIVGELHDEIAWQAMIAGKPYSERASHALVTPRLPQCYTSLAHGARGLISAPLAGEMIASTIAGDINMGAIGGVGALLDPARFARRAWRYPTH